MRNLLRGAAGVVGAALLTIACSSDGTKAVPGAGGDQSAGQGGGKATDWCPAVVAVTSADISADFSLPIAVAQTGVFHACRNNGCLQIELSGSSDFRGGSAPSPEGGVTVVVHNDPSREPYVELNWVLPPDQTSDYTRTDLYTLSVDHDGISTELIRASTTYVQTFYSTADTYNLPDPTICGSWGEAVVDLRTNAGQLNGGAGAQAVTAGTTGAGASGADAGGAGANADH